VYNETQEVRKMLKPVNQIAIGNNSGLMETSTKDKDDSLEFWYKVYFSHAVTTSQTSQKVQVRDISLFIRFAEKEGVTTRPLWTPRLSRAFQDFLQKFLNTDGQRYWSDRTANRILAHIKTFAGWIHQLAPFPLGNPMQEIRLMPVGSSLDVNRALSSAERRRLLDAADLLPSVAGRSKDRRRNKHVDPVDRPMRKNARPWRNRAMVYALIETGMRRAAVVNLNIEGIDWGERLIAVTEKGGMTHSYPISDQGLGAIRDYITHERHLDNTDRSSALFLPALTIRNSNGRLTPLVINQEWEEVCAIANISHKTPHAARHAMGRHIIDKTGNIAAVQRQLGHRNVAYSVQYARVSNKEMLDVLNNRS
jgi:site-specific recombinase XerD